MVWSGFELSRVYFKVNKSKLPRLTDDLFSYYIIFNAKLTDPAKSMLMKKKLSKSKVSKENKTKQIKLKLKCRSKQNKVKSEISNRTKP